MRRLYAENPEKFRERRREWHWANRETSIAISAAWRAQNAERVLAYTRHYYALHRSEGARKKREWIAANPDWGRQYAAMQRDTLADTYVKKSLSVNYGIPHAFIPPALVDAQRVNLQIKRLLKDASK